MQEVIVYRNPAEAVFWAMMIDGSMVPIAAGALAAIVPAWKTYTALALAGVAWILVARCLWI